MLLNRIEHFTLIRGFLVVMEELCILLMIIIAYCLHILNNLLHNIKYYEIGNKYYTPY